MEFVKVPYIVTTSDMTQIDSQLLESLEFIRGQMQFFYPSYIAGICV